MLTFMDERLNRRSLLKTAIATAIAGAANLLPSNAEGAKDAIQLTGSPLTPEMLREQKERAIRSLKMSIPDDPKADYLRTEAQNLEKESQMYIPDSREIEYVQSKAGTILQDELRDSADGDFILFPFADVFNRKRIQRFYVIERVSNTQARFVKGYKVSMAEAGFGNEKDSRKTPLGRHTIHSGKIGMYGEVVSELNKYKDDFNLIRTRGEDHWFVKGFGKKNLPSGHNRAEVVTDQFLLQGPETDTERGIRIHGTNRSGEVRADGQWETFLDGKYPSGACIRMSNVDVRDLSLSHYISVPSKIRGKKKSTRVVIYATPEALAARESDIDPETSSLPRRWNESPSSQSSQVEKKALAEPGPVRPISKPLPRRWNE